MSIRNIRKAFLAAGIEGADEATMTYDGKQQVYTVAGEEFRIPLGVTAGECVRRIVTALKDRQSSLIAGKAYRDGRAETQVDLKDVLH